MEVIVYLILGFIALITKQRCREKGYMYSECASELFSMILIFSAVLYAHDYDRKVIDKVNTEVVHDTIGVDGKCDTIILDVVKPKSKSIVSSKTEKKNNADKGFTTHVTLTVYNPVASQCDKNPNVTADGTKIDLNKLKRGQLKYCAVSRDLLPFLPYGSMIEIEGHGVYVVHDTMNKRFNHYIDILQHSDEPIFKKSSVKITKLA